MWKQYLEYMATPAFWIPRIILLALCPIHDRTAYHTARNLAQLFYWPEGPCLDMVVVGLFLIVAAICCFNDIRWIVTHIKMENWDYDGR